MVYRKRKYNAIRRTGYRRKRSFLSGGTIKKKMSKNIGY